MSISAAEPESIKVSLAGHTSGWEIVGSFLELLLLSLWVGGMIFFAFSVAPSAFAVLPTRHLAGLVVTSTLSKLELIGLFAGPLLIVAALAGTRGARAREGRVSRIVRIALLAIMTSAAGLSRYAITPTMVSLRNSMNDLIDNVPASDPLRMEFDRLHQYSVGLMSLAMFAGLVVLFLTVRSLKRS
jgi:hypothetical protein